MTKWWLQQKGLYSKNLSLKPKMKIDEIVDKTVKDLEVTRQQIQEWEVLEKKAIQQH